VVDGGVAEAVVLGVVVSTDGLFPAGAVEAEDSGAFELTVFSAVAGGCDEVEELFLGSGSHAVAMKIASGSRIR